MGVQTLCLTGALVLSTTVELCSTLSCNPWNGGSHSWMILITTVVGTVSAESNQSVNYGPEIGRIFGYSLLGVVIVIKIILVVCCYHCPCCPGYKRRKQQREYLQHVRVVQLTISQQGATSNVESSRVECTNQTAVYGSYPNGAMKQDVYPPPYWTIEEDDNPPPYATAVQRDVLPPPYEENKV